MFSCIFSFCKYTIYGLSYNNTSEGQGAQWSVCIFFVCNSFSCFKYMKLETSVIDQNAIFHVIFLFAGAEDVTQCKKPSHIARIHTSLLQFKRDVTKKMAFFRYYTLIRYRYFFFISVFFAITMLSKIATRDGQLR